MLDSGAGELIQGFIAFLGMLGKPSLSLRVKRFLGSALENDITRKKGPK